MYKYHQNKYAGKTTEEVVLELEGLESISGSDFEQLVDKHPLCIGMLKKQLRVIGRV